MDQQDLLNQENDQALFENTFATAVENPEVRQEDLDYGKYITPLGRKLEQRFHEYEIDRSDQEDVWIKALRQYRGEYDPEVKILMHPKRSKAFLSLTRMKVRTSSSRLTDLLFPANGDKNWAIRRTPMPELNPQLIQGLVAQYAKETGTAPDEAFIRKFINEEADRRAEAMACEMHDQLTEAKYRPTIRDVIESGHLYGTGVLKGPLVKMSLVKRWLPDNAGGWVNVEVEKIVPWLESVPIWDIYPDMSARKPEDMRGIFQRYVMNRNKVSELAQRADFNGAAITAYLKANPDGDAEFKNHENYLRNLNPEGTENTGFKDTSRAGVSNIGEGKTMISRKGKYEVREFWGYMGTDELKDVGVEIPESKFGLEVVANVWLLGPVVIKASISALEGAAFPYYFYYFHKDDSSIFGSGIPMVMRDAQKLYNASIRAMLDNAAISAGPLIEANTDLLDVNEDPKDVYPFRVFLRDGAGAEATAPAIRVFEVKSYTSEFLQMASLFSTSCDDVTLMPKFMYGEPAKVGTGAGATASGLSMLMGAANVSLKDQMRNFDEGITVPFITALYFWNMDFSKKEHIKGDFAVSASGSTSLIAREVKAESLASFLRDTNNPTDLLYLKRWNVLREYTKVLDLEDLDLVKDANTVKIEEQARAEAAAEEQQFVRDLAMAKAKSGGHMAEEGTDSTRAQQGVVR